MKKIEKVPKYCSNCGNKLEQEVFVDSYSEEDGKPQYKIRVICEYCHSNGDVVYFRMAWDIDQSQTQPEVTTNITSNNLGVDKPEKQEEWRDEFFDRFVNEDDKSSWDRWRNQDPHVVADFISQLLSERTFNKTELDYLREFVDFRKEHYKSKGGTNDWYYEKMLAISRKISKLLNKEEQ